MGITLCSDCEAQPAYHERFERDARGKRRAVLLCAACASDWDDLDLGDMDDNSTFARHA